MKSRFFPTRANRALSLAGIAAAILAISACSKEPKEAAATPSKPEAPVAAPKAATPAPTPTPAPLPAVTVSKPPAVEAKAATAGPALDTVDQRVSYGVGFNVGGIMAKQNADLKVDPDALRAGIEDGMARAKTRISGEELQAAFAAVTQRAADKLKAETELFFKNNRARPEVTVTPSGLQYEVLVHGKGGPKPKPTDKVSVNYRGTLLDGTVFDSSDLHGGPAEFGVREVVPGWIEALQLMSVGDKFRLYVPAGLAYGSRGNGKIPPNAPLIFDIELLGIK
jgi:FKBP-type peptidyl-prolyl cis-trans isomerase